jgi:hypothetical protein
MAAVTALMTTTPPTTPPTIAPMFTGLEEGGKAVAVELVADAADEVDEAGALLDRAESDVVDVASGKMVPCCVAPVLSMSMGSGMGVEYPA